MKYTYEPADKEILFNDGDVDLTPIKYKLPSPPQLEQIDGYGLDPKDQKWVHKPMPAKLRELNERTDMTASQKVKHLETHQAYYEDEIKYIIEDIHRKKHGYWFFIKGKPYWITGDNYFYLQWWPIEGKPVQFRMRDRKWWLFSYMCDHDKNTYGFNYPKHRREGATTRVSCKRYLVASTTPFARVGLQSKDAEHAKEVHRTMVLDQFKYEVPFWHKPIWDNNNQDESTIRFYAPEARNNPDHGKKSLKSIIDYRDSGTKAYDGLKLRYLHNDETGKCLSVNTLVLMYDGTKKKVQDIVVGDQLMGPDSKPRTVLSVTSGEDEMYEVIPKKGEPWGCNQHHILSLNSCYIRKIKGVEKFGTVNISVNDYLKLTPNQQKHLMQYRVGVDFPHKDVWEPYFLGFWLGNGHHRDPRVFINDNHQEIFDDLMCFAERNNYGYSFRQKPGCKEMSFTNGVIGKIKEIGVQLNKRIPAEYLYNSREVRLQVLAGLIDSDGCKDQSFYSITQKRKHLSEDIVYLAQSLGYFVSFKTFEPGQSSLVKKHAGNIHYRIRIWGNSLEEIPVRNSYKKMPPHSTHKNRKNPCKVGFKLEHKGKGTYYGFTIDGDHLFLLGDFTVTHNTTTVNIKTRWEIQRQCLSDGGKIIGKTISTSTVDEMQVAGGRIFKDLCDQSHYHQRTESGRTISGLYNFFMPASQGFDGVDKDGVPFLDEYGFDRVDEDGVSLSEKYHLAIREGYRKAGDTEGLIEYTRQFPLKWKDCWKQSARECNFNLAVIEDRLDHYRNGNPDVQRGNFMWVGAVQDSAVEWIPDPEGRFILSYQFDDPRMANKCYWEDGRKFPSNTTKFVAGGDPYRFKTTKTSRKSMGAGAVFMYFDSSIDGTKDINEWTTNRFTCSYEFRPKDKEAYGEDMIMMCHYFGCKMFPEINVDFLWEYFERRGYGGYLFFPVDPHTGKISRQPGAQTGEKMKEEIFREWQYYIEKHGRRERHIEFFEQCKEIEDDMGDYDLFVAGGLALVAAKKAPFSAKESTMDDVQDLFPTYYFDNGRQI